MHVGERLVFLSGLVSTPKRDTLETFLRNRILNQPGVTSERWSCEGILETNCRPCCSLILVARRPIYRDHQRQRTGPTDRHPSTYRLKWGLLYQRPQQHNVTKATNGTYTLNTNIFKLKATLKSTNLYIRLHGSMTAFIDFFKGTVCNSRLPSLHGSSLVLIQAGTQTCREKRQPIVWGRFPPRPV